MDKKYKGTVVEELIHYLEADTKKYIKKQGVSPEEYLAFVYNYTLREGDAAGYAITVFLTFSFGFIAYNAGQEYGHPWIAALCFGALGLLIGGGGLRYMHGKKSKYVDHPDNTSSGFIRMGVMDKTSLEYVKKINAKGWENVKKFSPNLNAKMYRHFVGDPKNKKERQELMKMTPEKEKHVARVAKLERFFWWAVLPGLLFPFFEGMFLLWWAWFSVGMAFFFLSYKGFVERRMGFFAAADTVELYGWPARLSAGLCMFIGVIIFILPGILGMFEEFGIHLIDVIF